MVNLSPELQRLGSASTRHELRDVLWDLRDSAYDNPGAWAALTPETMLQAMAEWLEDDALSDGSWQPSARLLAHTFATVLRLGG